MSSATEDARAAQVIASQSAVPTNVMSLDSPNNVTAYTPGQNTTASAGESVQQSLGTTPITSTYVQQLASNGVRLNPQQNPLNIYANYTYHIRFSLLNETNANQQDGTYQTMTNTPKSIIAESGVTAGFNITDFEFKNTCAPGHKNLNTTSTTWTMTIAEPYGMSLIDKMLSAGVDLPVINWSRAPYFIEVWFNGYNEDGTIMPATLYYTQYRVIMIDMDVKVTEGGSVYSLNGVFDGDIGHSNEISIPPAKFTVTATTVGDFFDQFTTALNSEASNVNSENKTITTYKFNVKDDLRKWPFKISQVDQTMQRSASMTITPEHGVTTFSNGKGASMENIINAIVGTCPQVSDWITGATNNGGASLLTNGIAKWLLIHSKVVITGFDNVTNDYIREVTYSVVPYSSIIGATDKNTINQLLTVSVQQNKLNYLISQNALIKEYDYVYTGLNTEVVRFDISIDNAWQIALPQWSALNTYYNFAQSKSYANSSGDLSALGQFKNNPSDRGLPSAVAQPDANTSITATGDPQANLANQSQALASIYANMKGRGIKPVQQSINPKQLTSGYIEDISTNFNNSGPFPIVVRQKNKPTAQLADVGGDTNKAMGNGGNNDVIPPSRAFVGSFLDTLFGNSPSFMNIELEIRGDPYWLGTGNVIENNTAAAFGVQNNTTSDIRANYLATSNMFILSFRTGENYNQDTGLMQFDTTSKFYNGAYGVTEVTNTFRQGSFTQTLSAYKDALAQLVTGSS